MVKEGTFALRVLQAGEAGEPQALQTVHRLAPGCDTDSCFGEIALVVGSTPYGGNIVARSSGTRLRSGCRWHFRCFCSGFKAGVNVRTLETLS